ncbi:unnamed protein product [Linum trigynum]|uniref:Transposase-associated domain-containing protein n=1 Tax=Linum trigynum TaxID=586398 RepID=A0AAV2FXH1_9ROSI
MKIKCPCVDCDNLYRRERTQVQSHLLYRGIKRYYTKWEHHGERDDPTDSSSDEFEEEENEMQTDDIQGLLNDLRPHFGWDNDGVNEPEKPNVEAKKFFRLLSEAEKPLYVGSEKHSNLSFLIKMMHIKCLNGWSNSSFTMLLKTVRETLPTSADFLPKNYYGAKKNFRDLGLHCEEIHVCKNDCIIYYAEHKNALRCEICSASKYKSVYKDSKGKVKKIPWKILRYFPIGKRLQRLFMSSQTAEYMVWHHEERSKDEFLRHPVDSEA